MADKRIRVRRLVWDRTIQGFAATDQAVQDGGTTVERPPSGTPRLADRYLKGPVPWSWIVVAARLPGKALIIGLCIWRLAGLKRSRTVVLGNGDLHAFAVDRTAKSRALTALESAGLIDIARRPGGLPIITLLDTMPLERAAKGGRRFRIEAEDMVGTRPTRARGQARSSPDRANPQERRGAP